MFRLVRAPRPLLLAALALTISPLAATAADSARMSAAAVVSPLLAQLRQQAPKADPQALALALEARECAIAAGSVADASRLAVIDFTRPSTEPRLWVFDLPRARLLYAEHVAHGRSSGENIANAFSNVAESHQSSLGLFTTAETYIGGNGYSLRMDGLEPGINDRARDRQIVIHGAAYVDPVQALRQGRLGRSYGCPALRPQVTREVIDTLKDGQLLFAYYPDREWLTKSRFIGCKQREVAASDAAQRPVSRNP